MLELNQVAELTVAAASGIVTFEERLCVIADDELFLAVYDVTGKPIARVALFPGELPAPYDERKRRKPDLEALCLLPDGRLLALGSGSTANRMRGVLIDRAPSKREGLLEGVLGKWRVSPIDLAPLYDGLALRIPELNVEGAVEHAGRLWLAQRGNGAAGMNALVELDLARALSELAQDHALSADTLCAVHPVALGDLGGAPLSLTDLTADAHHGLMFTAAAEATANTYDDGECTGSAIGMLALDGTVTRLSPVAPACKLEGIAVAASTPQHVQLWLVADADDRAKPAPLLQALLTL